MAKKRKRSASPAKLASENRRLRSKLKSIRTAASVSKPKRRRKKAA